MATKETIITKETRVIDLTLGELINAISNNSPTVPTVPNVPEDELGGIDLAMQVTGLARQTIYGMTHKKDIPFMRSGKKHLRFSKTELINWLKSQRRLTNSEIAEISNVNFSKRKAFRNK